MVQSFTNRIHYNTSRYTQYKSKQNSSQARTINLEDSVDKAEIVLGICEGEIEGLEHDEESFFVSDTSLKNSNGDDNFADFNLKLYTGSGVNEELDYQLGGSARSTSVGVTLAKETPVVRQTQTGDLDFIEVRVVVQSLLSVSKKGKQRQGTLKLKVEYKAASAENWININNNAQQEDSGAFILKGKITSPAAQEFRINVTRINEPYEIRVTKYSEDDQYHIVQWESFQEGFKNNNEFPHTALAHIYLQYSDQLTSVPSFYGIYKLMRIRVPSNYDPETREYDGAWDGTFKVAWSDNPAWCLYDYVMNDRYGCNAFSEVTLDKWDCYEAAQWCDELVSNGRGGTEPRYTCNLVQTEATNGREFAAFLAATFNGVLVEPATGYLRLFVEKDSDAVFLFTPENVTETGFSYSFTSPETRYNDIKVSFTNPNLNWEADTRRVYNQTDIDKNGRVTYDFAAVGCIREGEAMRRAYYKLITSLTEKTTVTFTTNRQAQALSNFDIILVADPVLGFSLPGRIKSISNDRHTVYLRDSIYLEASIPYKMQINLPSGLYETEVDPLSGTGAMKEFTVRDALPEDLPELAAFTLSGSDRSGTPKPFRIMSIAEAEGNPDQFSITALELNRNKWDAADNMVFEDMADYSGLPSPSDIPQLLEASFYLSFDPVNLTTELTITPKYDESYPYYSGRLLVYSRPKGSDDDSWEAREVRDNNIVVDHPTGEYEFKILPVSTTGVTAPFDPAPIFTYDVGSTNVYPTNITGLTADRSTNGVQLSWDLVDDIDLMGYEIREGDDWETATLVVTDLSGTSFFVPINDAEVHTYLVAAKNYLGNYSQVPALISTTVAIPDNVPAFYATVSLDRVRFDWVTVPGNDIEYEIRQGDNWATAIKIAKLKGNNTTVLLPSSPLITYCIKACTPAGLYSLKPRYTHPDMELQPDRNIIKQIDNGAQGFPGITYGFDDGGQILPGSMIMTPGLSRAEHYFNVELEKETRARNWLDTVAFSNPQRRTWLDLPYMYTQPEAHISWIGSKTMDSEGDIEPVILKYLGPEAYAGYLGFPYTEYTHDIRDLISSTSESNISYADARFAKGLLLQANTKLIYSSNINIPEVFHLVFKLKIDNTSSESLNLITLIGDDRNYIKIYTADGKIYCRCSDHKNMVITYRHATAFDFLTFGYSQSGTERSLYFFADYANFETSQTIEATPLGAFTRYYINRNIGEDL